MVNRTHVLAPTLLIVLLALAACGEDGPSVVAPVTTPTATKEAAPAARLSTTTAVPLATLAPVTTATASPAPEATPTTPPSPTPTATDQPAEVGVATAVSAQPETATPEPTPTALPTREVLPTPTTEPSPTAVPLQTTTTPVSVPTVVANEVVPRADRVSLSDQVEPLTTVEVVKLLRPSVVHIATQGQPMGRLVQPVPLEGVGTGVILDKKGNILTNYHVVDGALEIIVTLNTGESFPATVVGTDSFTDTAVIRISAEGLQPALLGDSDTLEVGEDVIAIGHALGLPGGPTVSKGVVSALGRSIETDPQTQTTIVDLIQTDASVNPGNSGGPLVRISTAEVVGINTAIIRGSQGIGFAININDAKVVSAQIIEKGFVERGFLGISPVSVTPAVASQLRLPGIVNGVLITHVIGGTAAAAAGLLPGDVILKLGGAPIANTGALSKFLMKHLPGETVEVVYLRNGTKVTTEVKLGERP